MKYKILILIALVAIVLLSGCVETKSIKVEQISNDSVAIYYPHPKCGFNDGYVIVEGIDYSDWHRPNNEPEIFTRLKANNTYKAFLACGMFEEFDEYDGIYSPVYFIINWS